MLLKLLALYWYGASRSIQSMVSGKLGSIAVGYCLFKQADVLLFQGLYIADKLATLMKLAIIAVCFFGFVYAREYIERFNIQVTEFFGLALFSIVGMLMLCSAGNLMR